MNAITGLVELLLEEETNSDTKESLTAIHDSSRSLMRILNDILDFSRLESGKVEIEESCFAIRQLLTTELRLFESQAASKGLVLSMICDPKVPKYLIADNHRLQQVLSNLLSNAIKFTAKGHIDIVCNVDKNLVEITVADTGIGISPNKKKVIFEEFMQADNSVTRSYGGTGLGLAISRQIMRLMGGTLELQKSDENGSVFRLEFPLIEGDGLPTAVHPSQIIQIKQ